MQAENITQVFSGILFSLTIFCKTFFQALGVLPAPCEQPLQYTLGSVDARFGITEAEVVEAAKKAEALWEHASGKDLFEYNKDSGLPLQLVYDERQQKTQAEQDLQARLENINVGKSEQQVKDQIAQFEQAKADYEKRLATYEREVEAYNNRVKKINKNGGATESQREDLIQQQKSLEEQFQHLESTREKVNSLVGATNKQIARNESLVEAYNQEITTFQEEYGGEGEVFDQGVYSGKDITIYQYDDMQRLVLVLAHEMGHALGIEHVEEPEALMYYLMRDQNVHTLRLHDADLQSLENICQSPKFPWNN